MQKPVWEGRAEKEKRNQSRLIDMLAHKKLDQGGTIMEAKKPCKKPEPGRDAVPIVTNIHPMKIKQDVTVYRYDVLIAQYFDKPDGSGPGRIYLTKKSFGGDSTAYDHRDKCGKIFTMLVADYAPLRDSRAVYYDLQSIVYSLDKLKLSENEKGEEKMVIRVQLNDEMRELLNNPTSVVATISPVKTSFEMRLQDMSGVSRDLSKVSRSLLQFIDIATSQSVMFKRQDHIPFSCHRSYLMEPVNAGFAPTDVAYFQDNSSYLAIGAQKSTHCIEGKDRARELALVVEPKKTPFHVCEPLVVKVNKIMVRGDVNSMASREKINAVLSGLEVQTRHLGYPRRYVVKQVLREDATQSLVRMDDGRQMSVLEFFRERHQIDLQQPKLPVIETKDGSKLPMEVCNVCDNERVKTNQQTSQQIQQMIRHCAVPLNDLRRQTDLTYDSLGLGLQNHYLGGAGIEVDREPISLTARGLDPPTLVFANNFASRVRPSDYTWQCPNPFLLPGSCKQWAVLSFLAGAETISVENLEIFVRRFTDECRRRGMDLPLQHYPLAQAMKRANRKTIEQELIRASNDGCDFIIVIHGDRDDETHELVKYYEQRLGVQTQEFRLLTVMKVVKQHQPVTIQNIVNKANLKLRGLNYTLSITDPVAKQIIGTGTLIIGIAVNHPGAGRKPEKSRTRPGDGSSSGERGPKHPSVVGYAANVGKKDDFEFIGNYLMHEFQGEIDIAVVPTIIKECLELYKQHRNQQIPKRVIFYHNGSNEGWFEYLLRFEVPLIKEALREGGCPNVPLTLIVPNRLHSVRFFQQQINPRDRPPEQNVKPGLLVDHTVVHSEFLEFFLNSHRALQGTARTPKYTVLIDEEGMSMEMLTGITYHLCYGHQIVFLPTSVPTPVYVAMEYAQRGRKVFNQWSIESGDQPGSDYQNINDELSYSHKESLKRHRLNA